MLLMQVFGIVHGQQAPEDWNTWQSRWEELPLEEQLATYMEMFKSEVIFFHSYKYANRLASRFGTRLIPHLKKHVLNADFSNLRNDPKDITLRLVAIIVYNIHGYASPDFEYLNGVYPERGKGPVDGSDVRWFVEQYKKRIDEYVVENRVIDTTVYFSELCLRDFVFNKVGLLAEYGHIHYDEAYVERLKKTIDYWQDYKLLKNMLKGYYEKRLNIHDLEIKQFEFTTPVYME
jgi:hypothetical protein